MNHNVLTGNQTKELPAPIRKLLINVETGMRATLQFDNGRSEVVTGMRVYTSPVDRPWEKVLITASAYSLSGAVPAVIDVWSTGNNKETLPEIGPSINAAGGVSTSPISDRASITRAVQVLAAATGLTTNGSFAPGYHSRCFVQNNGPAAIEVSTDSAFAVGSGVIIAAAGGNLTLQISETLYARTVDGSNQVAPDDTRIYEGAV